MNKTIKGALAAGAAVVLLTGGATTLAYWTATDSAEGGAITAGTLTLTSNDDCAAWEYAEGSASAGQPVTLFVPGDVVTTTCTFTIGATGDNLAATLTAPESIEFTTQPTGTSFAATVDAGYGIGDAGAVPAPIGAGGTITDDNNGDVLTVDFDVTIPFGTDETGTPLVNANDTQSIVATLDTLTVTLTQTNPNA